MRAVTWHGKHDVRVETVPDPEIVNPRDAILKITSTAICGSDLHLYDSFVPGLHRGDILGHEFMGEVVAVGSEAANTLKVGDRVRLGISHPCTTFDKWRAIPVLDDRGVVDDIARIVA